MVVLPFVIMIVRMFLAMFFKLLHAVDEFLRGF